MKNISVKVRIASTLLIINSIDVGYTTCVFVSFVNDALDILCFVEKSRRIPSWRESLKIISFELITDLANPDGVSGFSHSIHHWSNRFTAVVRIEHSIPLDSKMLSKYC